MLIKKAYLGEFRHLLSIIRLANLDNRHYVAFSKRKYKYAALLGALVNLGFIESYEERNEIVVVYLKQVYWKSFQTPVHPFTEIETASARLRKDRNHKFIGKRQYREGHAVHAVLSTDRGLISAWDAISKKTGGSPLFRIY